MGKNARYDEIFQITFQAVPKSDRIMVVLKTINLQRGIGQCSENVRYICQRIADIYNYYIENTIITFEEEAISPDIMAQRILNIMALYPWLVSEELGNVVGYAYADRWGSGVPIVILWKPAFI